ncbi:hypothetical protein CCAX7_61500 [Capsulimonas corticalis]|uniref:Uncharacterized protein n=1 Tax=Capsulimonas corticalis TaxID=2219043 RepID=A0A402CW82_9BACT|nr:SpoIIE family protein phosphatase [Capsulimonas corticalis]BDI34099.1 hypothetical protein CCAX7_61500 [Capsulimonas corticalis]
MIDPPTISNDLSCGAPFALDTHPTLATAETSTDALKVSELRYRRLFEAARDGILLLEADHGRITDANPFMTELLGYSHDELLGKELWEIGLIKDQKASRDAFQKLKQHGSIRYENLPLVFRGSETRQVEFVSNLYQEGSETVIQCNIRDITHRKKAEAELVATATKNERIAATLQRAMLQSSPSGKFPGLLVETLYEAALHEAEVGGDFFDAFALSECEVALVVGDVSGKGLFAAGRTAEVKYALRAFLHEYHSPEIALAHLNEIVRETHRLDKNNEETFIILALVVVNIATGEARFSSAGAEATLILRASGAVEQIECRGMPLGVKSDETYILASRLLAPRETVLMATDGITEARRGLSFLGIAGMAALAEKGGPHASSLDLIRSIYDGAREFAGGHLRDDVCLLLARRQ